MKNIIQLIDSIISRYLGFDNQLITPQYLKIIDKKMVLVNTASFKRHLYSQKLSDFISISLNKLNNSTKQNIGTSSGKAIANHLTISFENVTIKEEI